MLQNEFGYVCPERGILDVSIMLLSCFESSVHVCEAFMCLYLQKDVKIRSSSYPNTSSSDSLLLKEASLLAVPVIMSSINLLLPGFFNAVAWMEQYDSPSVLNYVSISRYRTAELNAHFHVDLPKVFPFHCLIHDSSSSEINHNLVIMLIYFFFFTSFSKHQRVMKEVAKMY